MVAAAARGAAPPPPVALRVVASFSILADLARVVAGEDASVAALVGPDADVHVFEPTPADARRVRDADLLVVNGLHFEGWLDRLLEAAQYRGRLVVASDGIVPRRRGNAIDPHAWQDLRNTRRYVENLRAALSLAAPLKAADFARRAAAYEVALGELDARVRARLSAIPPTARRVITTHDAFGYLGAAYGIEFLALQGWSTDAEPNASDVARLIELARQARVRAIFVENISDPRLAQRISAEAGVPVAATLYSDALSRPGTEADTFLRMFEHNADALAAALGA